MLKQMAIAAFLSVPAVAQTHPPAMHYEQLDEIMKIKCNVQIPEHFDCAILFDVGFPSSGNMIASIVGGFVDQISLILDSTLYTVVYDPPLKRDDKFSLKARFPARIDGDTLSFNGRTAHTRGVKSFGAKRSIPIGHNLHNSYSHGRPKKE